VVVQELLQKGKSSALERKQFVVDSKAIVEVKVKFKVHNISDITCHREIEAGRLDIEGSSER
jgi:hypothetical protein